MGRLACTTSARRRPWMPLSSQLKSTKGARRARWTPAAESLPKRRRAPREVRLRSSKQQSCRKLDASIAALDVFFALQVFGSQVVARIGLGVDAVVDNTRPVAHVSTQWSCESVRLHEVKHDCTKQGSHPQGIVEMVVHTGRW